MKVVSIHSHKGGAGKTTFSLVLAKAHAIGGERVCAVDLDLIGTGIYGSIGIRKKNILFLDDFLLSLDDEIPSLDHYLARYEDEDLPDNSISLILNSGAVANDADNRDSIHRLQSLEPRGQIIQEKIGKILDELKAAGFTFCILDCHPGFSEVSRSVMRLQAENSGKLIFCSTTDRSHAYGTAWEIYNLCNRPESFDPESLILLLNRVSGNRYDTLEKFWNELEADPVLSDKVSVLKGQAEIVNYICLKDHPSLKFLDIGTSGMIPALDPCILNFSDTEACRELFKGFRK